MHTALVPVMRKLFAILIFALGVFAFESADIAPSAAGRECEVVDMHHEQLVCNNRHNIDIEPTTSIVVPSVSVRTATGNFSRQVQQRVLHLQPVEHLYTTTNYPTTQFILQLGSFARAVDFYLYTLCQLRL